MPGDADGGKPYPSPQRAGTGEVLSLKEIYAILIDRGHSKSEIERLDDFWLYHIFWHPRDKNGNILVTPKEREKPRSRRDYWMDWGRALGVPDWHSLERYAEEVAAEKRQAVLKAAQAPPAASQAAAATAEPPNTQEAARAILRAKAMASRLAASKKRGNHGH